LPFFYHQSGAA